jgi:Mrp family chromosome partitioning ATPase/capsular polysaccharide biosynthesis protein
VGDSGTHHASTLRDYLSVARRRKWIILAALLLVPATAVYLSVRQQKLYESSALVYLSMKDLAGELTGATGGSQTFDPVEAIRATQAELARAPVIAQRVSKDIHRARTAGEILGETGIAAAPDSDILTFSVIDPDPALAAKIANAYANEFTIYQTEANTAAYDAAAKKIKGHLDELATNGDTNSGVYQALVRNLQEVETLAALQTKNAQLYRPANYAYQVQPRPFRNGVFAVVLGLFLGIGLALLREALDTRVRSAEEIGEKTGLPLLARLPEPPRRLRRDHRLVMLDQPNGVAAEAFRMLRTNLEFVRLERRAKTIMVTSAVEAEGKSTSIANLAIALARVGQRVALVDLDLRRPFLHRFFDLQGPGLTQVALGYAGLDDALVQIPISGSDVLGAGGFSPGNGYPNAIGNGHGNGNGNGNGHGNGHAQTHGRLEVLPAGPIPPNVDEFLGSQRVAEIIEELRDRVDVVLVDSTPLLVVGDAMALTRSVDALMLITRLNVVRKPMLRELKRVLDGSPVEKLGYVVTGSGSGDAYYGYQVYSYYTRGGAQAQEAVR